MWPGNYRLSFSRGHGVPFEASARVSMGTEAAGLPMGALGALRGAEDEAVGTDRLRGASQPSRIMVRRYPKQVAAAA